MDSFFSGCILCGAACAPLKGYEAHFLVRCKKCKLVFASRIPSLDELLACYAEYPRDNSISPITLKRCNQLLDHFEAFRKTNKIIDVGAGDGWFLHEAMKRGWEAYGTEFEDRAVENCRSKGIRMQKGVLDPIHYTPGEFDIVTSFEVVEHISNPREEFAYFNRILRPGGLVYVTTPNFNSVSRDLLKSNWDVVHYPEHLTYYTPSTLTNAFARSGFSRRWITTAGLSYSRYRHSAGKEGGGLNDEKIRAMTEHNIVGMLVKRAVNGVLHVSRKGDGIKAEFVKH